MNINEKINIYVPNSVGVILERDMRMFEIFKRNRKSFNWNRFLTMVIRGYYDTYITENKALHDQIVSAIQTESLSEKEKNEIAESIVHNVINSDADRRGGKGSRHLSLKPTEGTIELIQRIIHDSDDYVSQCFRRMLICYSKKPFSKREQIVFYEVYSKLVQYCNTQQPIFFSTIWEDGIIHEVIPYSISIGPEEMYNFLLCQERNPLTLQLETRAYAIHRIRSVNINNAKETIDPIVKNRLIRMEKNGPQYSINDDEEIRIKLFEEGLTAYNRIYFGRPNYERFEEVEDGQIQYYKCSKDQVYLYFRRFDPTSFEILAPDSLRERMKCFYQKGLSVYN